MELNALQDYANEALMWIGFGTILGLIAKAVMPERDSGSSVATVTMGIVGTLIGCALLKYFYGSESIPPVSWRGFFVGIAGATVVIVFYKALGSLVTPGEESMSYRHRLTRRRRRRAYLDE